jgi:hypothetical protein
VFTAGAKEPLALAGPLDRLRGLPKNKDVHGWYVVPAAGVMVDLPRGKLTVEALSGLETALARREIDLTGKPPERVEVPLTFLFRPASLGLTAGNPHLHLSNLTRAEADEYLRTVPVADGLKVVFLSYLERAKADATYVTNEYPTGDLDAFRPAGLVVNNGEEYRHNLGPGGQGYGHVMFLNMTERIRPASLGPGITGAGFDDTPLRRGIDAARRQGATVLWCHNTFGFELVPSALTGRIDALNVYDGSRLGTFDDVYYKLLNVGLRLPVSTGTDWFVYDFSRDYVKVDGTVTPASWLAGLKAGRCVLTNGPLLTLTVDEKEPGAVLTADGPRKAKVDLGAVGRLNFTAVELVHNGTVVARQLAEKKGEGYRAALTRELNVDGPGWLAARVVSPTRTEFGQTIYAHTSPVYLEAGGRRPFVAADATALRKQVATARDSIAADGSFSAGDRRRAVLAVYDEAEKLLTDRIKAGR